MATGTRVQFEALRSLAFGGISGTYAAVGTAFLNRAVIVSLINTTDVTLTFSFGNGVDNAAVPSGKRAEYNFGSNNNAPASQLGMAAGTIVSVKGGPGSGSAYVEVAYNN